MTASGYEAASKRVREVLEVLVKDRAAVARSDGTVHDLFPVATSPEEGESLRGWVEREDAVHTIEVGLGYGISSLYICDGLIANGKSGALHVAIDPHQATRFANCALQFLEDSGVRKLVEHHDVESQLALPTFVRDCRKFDLAFVDGNHRFDGVFVDLIYLGRLVHPGGIIFVDDYQLASVTKAVSFCVTNLGWTIEERSSADERHHWVVLRTGAHTDMRSFDHFVDF